METDKSETAVIGTEHQIEETQSNVEPSKVNAMDDDKLSSQSIHWKADDESKLDFSWYQHLGVIYGGILFGAILTLIIGLISGIGQGCDYGIVSAICSIVPSAVLGILGIVGALCLAKRKPNSIFLCLVYTWICTIGNFLNIILCLIVDTFPGFLSIFWMGYGIVLLFIIYCSEEVKLIFPKEYRKISNKDVIFAAVAIFLEAAVLMSVLAMVMAVFRYIR